MPPSFGGTCRCSEHRRSRASAAPRTARSVRSRFWKQPPVSATRARRRGGATATRAATRALWKRAAMRPDGHAGAQVGQQRSSSSGRQSSAAAARRQPGGDERAGRSCRAPRRRPRTPAPWPPRPRSRTRWRRPSRAATASNRRPALVVTGALSGARACAAARWRSASERPCSGRRGRALESALAEQLAEEREARRGAARAPPRRRRAAGRVAGGPRARTRGVAEQELAAPDGAVGAEPGAVPDDAEGGPVQPFSARQLARWAWWCCTATRGTAGAAPGARSAQAVERVVRVQVVGDRHRARPRRGAGSRRPRAAKARWPAASRGRRCAG